MYRQRHIRHRQFATTALRRNGPSPLWPDAGKAFDEGMSSGVCQRGEPGYVEELQRRAAVSEMVIPLTAFGLLSGSPSPTFTPELKGLLFGERAG